MSFSCNTDRKLNMQSIEQEWPICSCLVVAYSLRDQRILLKYLCLWALVTTNKVCFCVKFMFLPLCIYTLPQACLTECRGWAPRSRPWALRWDARFILQLLCAWRKFLAHFVCKAGLGVAANWKSPTPVRNWTTVCILLCHQVIFPCCLVWLW